MDELREKLFEKSIVVESDVQIVPPSDVGPSDTKVVGKSRGEHDIPSFDMGDDELLDIEEAFKTSIYMFKEGLNPPDNADITCFEEWFHDGYKPAKVGIYPFLYDFNAINNHKSFFAYVMEEYMHCNTGWWDVHHILIPIMIESHAHWLLGHFDVNKRVLNIYNSARATVRDRVVIQDVQAFGHVLPYLMVKVNAWNHVVSAGVGSVPPLAVNIVEGTPQQTNG
ncbi:Ulp1 protease family [Abeliophyllum distichum]|uniref:Ulp1 protease family n=1 Tax=Abeliophyllum distichum TaxID=126358 RepID=A0ABD1QW54_9LAMI